VTDWIEEVSHLCEAGRGVVLITVASAHGSAPREIGARMIVSERTATGSIGGGRLEYECTQLARQLCAGEASATIRRFPLGGLLGQCCGGVVEILFESIPPPLPTWLRELRALRRRGTPAVVVTSVRGPAKLVISPEQVISNGVASAEDRLVALARGVLEQGRARLEEGHFFEPLRDRDLHIAVFGAGHVGRAVVGLLASLDCDLRWVDSRPNVFLDMPPHVRTIETEAPSEEIAAMPPASFYLVMTHSHPLDFELCDQILRRGDAAYCGLIGSATKRRRFEHRFRQQGLSPSQMRTLVCPIGIEGIPGKQPAEIAIATAAEVLRIHHRSGGPHSTVDLQDTEARWNPS